MDASIEEQIATILKHAPTAEDYLAPIRAEVAILQKQLAEAKTNPERRAISRKLKKHLQYLSHADNRDRQKRPSARQIRREKAEEKKLAWLVRKTGKNRR